MRIERLGLCLVLLLTLVSGCAGPTTGAAALGSPSPEPAGPSPEPVGTEAVGGPTPVEQPGMPITMQPVEVGACTAFIAPDGDDGAPGTQMAPWRTLTHAAESAKPGDVICVRAGTYPTEEVVWTVSGAPEAPITLMAYPGETVVLDGQGSAGGIFTFKEGASYLHLSGFVVRGHTVWGISLEGGNHDIWLDHLDVSGGEAGIHFTVGESGQEPLYGPVERVTVEDSVVHDVVYTAVDCTPGPCNDIHFRRVEIYGAGLVGESYFGSDGLAIERGQPITVVDCVVHDNGGDGIDLNSRDWDGNVQGILVQRNRVYRNHLQAIKLWAGGRMENNLVWGQGINPVTLGVYPGVYEVVNNTVAYNMWDVSYGARDYAMTVGYPEGEGGPATLTLTLINNIFAFNTGPQVGEPTGIYLGAGVSLEQVGGNLFFSRADGEIQAEFVTGRDPWFTQADIAGGAWAALTGSLGDRVADPLFVSGWPEVDLHLLAGSSAIDAGVVEGAPPDDIDGNPRDGSPDCGAYEYTGGS